MTLEVKSLQDYVNELSATVQAIKEEIDMIASGGFMPAGSVYFADLPALIDERYGFVYNIKDAFVTTSDFIEGPGKSYSAGTNVGIVRDEERELKYDVLSSFVDTAAIFGAIELKQSMTLSKEIAGANTVEGALESLDNNIGITIDDELSTTSTNPVQNKVIKSALDAKANTDGKIAEAYSADYAAKAANDAHNNNIANTYATKTELSDGLSGKVNAVAGKGLSSNDYTNEDKDYVDGLPAQLLGKQDALTFDDTPTDGSNNPVKSNGIYDALANSANYIANTGVKNLIPIPFLYEDVSGDGLTYTINSDGTVEIDGTASATKRFYLIAISSDFIFEKGQTYTLTDGTSDSANNKYVLEMALFNGNTYANKAFRTANGSVTFTLPTDIEYDRVTLYFVVYNGVQLSHKLFKPMLRYSAVKNADYVYAKTNKQLTDDVSLLDSKKTDTDMVAADFNAGTSYTAGNYCVQDGKLYKFKNNHSGAWSSADVDEVKITGELSALKSGLTNYQTQNDLNLEVPNRKNILPLTLADLKKLNSDSSWVWNGNSVTVSGVTFDISTDSDGKVTGITCNGTATTNVYMQVTPDTGGVGLQFLEIGKQYIVSGGSQLFKVRVYHYNGATSAVSTGNEATFTMGTSVNGNVDIYVEKDSVLNNVSITPMIRPATITDPTFAPYIPSVESRIEAVESGLTSVSGKIPIRGSFTVHCSVGNNVFSRNTMDLVAGSIPQSHFNSCIMMIGNHGSNNTTNDTIQVDGSEAIIINAQIEQNITVTWLDISNIPIANN